MKQLFMSAGFLLACQFGFSQVVRDHKANTIKEPVKAEVKTFPAGKEVILYENPNYNGRFKSMVVGQYKLDDFNDLGSSITVPAGLVAVIYEHANEKGGYGNYVDLMEDCPDLSLYNFNGKTSYVIVFNPSSRPGYVWVRNRMNNNQFVPGHWERARADGTQPENSPPGVVSSLSESGTPDDYTYSPPASPAEINEFNDIRANQLNVGVLDGETTKAFYYHHNQPGEDVYKYNKVIDPARLPGKFFDWAANELGRAGILIRPLGAIVDLAGDIKDWIFGSSSTKMNIDCWYPVSEFKTTVCGKMKGDAFVCGQDYLHTKVTVDKDLNYEIFPYDRFKPMLINRWIGDKFDVIEGEVKSTNLANFNTSTGKSTETLTPRNPLLLQVKKDDNVCLYGPWMGDILDLNAKLPVPFTDTKIELVNIDLRNNNEIHPVNQLWKKVGNELQLTAIVDGTGYFEKTGNGEIAASGLYQRMRFYIAFLLPAEQPGFKQPTREYNIDGIAFDATDYPVLDVKPELLTLKYKGATCIKVNDNSLVRLQKTHKVFFDKVRTRADGSLQGYIVVETEPISKKGGSINITVKDLTPPGRPVIPRDKVPVKVKE